MMADEVLDLTRLPERTAGEIDTEATFMWVYTRQKAGAHG